MGVTGVAGANAAEAADATGAIGAEAACCAAAVLPPPDASHTVLSVSASGAPNRDAPLGAAGAAAATATGGMSRRCERVNNGAFARVTAATSLGAVS